ncbi:hypothetical protein F4604DRAFT_1925032 [Suillus subluteus]|nr:hypothetical protein F4604DRAFT_1925032 [Suillus subluteus]
MCVSLRRDSRICAFESASKHHEPKRVEKSQTVKAAGTSSDTYTKAELIRCSLWSLTDFSGPQYIFVGIHDRAMLLVSAATAFHGEGCRMLEWSDLFPATVPLDQTNEIQVLAALADNAKHNQTGRIDEHGAIQHVHPELCPVGALAFLFFAHFHILNCAPPDFAPDFSNKNYGKYGRREWYDYHVFYTGGPTKEMTYENHRDCIMNMHMKNNIDTTKKTHAGCHYAAQTACAHGASVNGTKALGGWSDNGSFNPVYDRAFPLDALLGAGMFNAWHPEDYALPRNSIVPPLALLEEIFPFIEQAQEDLKDRTQCSQLATDIALHQFLSVLLWFRLVLLQDAALLYTKHPKIPMFRFKPFNTQCFWDYAHDAVQAVMQAEEQARMAFHNLPQHLVCVTNDASS